MQEEWFLIVKTLLCIPTLNPGSGACRLAAAIRAQSLHVDWIAVVDSGSTDDSLAPLEALATTVIRIARAEFDHGATRKMGVEKFPEADLVIFLTQDAIPADPEAFAKLVACLQQDGVGAAYGRQLPRMGAGPIEAYARLFNYPSEARLKTREDIPILGLKTAFISNSFAGYRRSALEQVGGFPSFTILGEDTLVAARMLLAGWHVVYCADAAVYHSHDYTPMQEFRRYFDTGVFHGQNPWLRQKFGAAEGEGLRYVQSELAYLLKANPLLIPSALIRTVFKWLGFRLGLSERLLPTSLKKRLSMNRTFWERAELGA
jgi:rhamnosyltransferase